MTIWRYSFDDGTYSHAPLIPLISIYLLYFSFTNNSFKFRQRHSWVAALCLLLAGIFYFISITAQISLGYWLSLLCLLLAAVVFLFCFNINITFPIFFLIFLLPIWGVLTTPLQQLSIAAVSTIMNMTSVPVYIEEQFVHIPSGTFEIAGGCSGLRYLLVSLAISSLYVFLYIRSAINATALIIFAILGALLTNWLRISALIIIGHETEMTSSLMEDHNNFGWYLYIPFMIALFYLGNKLASEVPRFEKKTNIIDQTVNLPNLVLVAITISTILFTSTFFFNLFSKQTQNTALIPSAEIQPLIHHYRFVENSSTADFKYYIYNFDGVELDGKPTFFDHNVIPEKWRVTEQSTHNNWQKIKVNNGKHYALILISYEIDGIFTATAKSFKLLRLKKALQGHRKTKLHWKFITCHEVCQNRSEYFKIGKGVKNDKNFTVKAPQKTVADSVH